MESEELKAYNALRAALQQIAGWSDEMKALSASLEQQFVQMDGFDAAVIGLSVVAADLMTARHALNAALFSARKSMITSSIHRSQVQDDEGWFDGLVGG